MPPVVASVMGKRAKGALVTGLVWFLPFLAAVCPAASNEVSRVERFTGVGEARPAVWTITPIAGTLDSAIRIDIAGFSAVEAEGGHSPRIPGQAGAMAAGTPEVPRLARLLAGHGGMKAVLELRGVDPTNVPGVVVAPCPAMKVEELETGGRRLRQYRVPDPAVYGKDDFWPAGLGRVEEACIGTQNVVRVECFPIQYNPFQKVLRFHRRLEGELRFERVEGGRSP